jgi:hypothetical protein
MEVGKKSLAVDVKSRLGIGKKSLGRKLIQHDGKID